MRTRNGYLIFMLLAALAMVLASCGGSGEGITTGQSSSGQTTTISGKVGLSSASSSFKPTPAMLMKADRMAEKASRSLNKARHEKTSLAMDSYIATLPGVPQFSMEDVYQKAGLASAIIIGDVSLYDAEHPEWLFPVSEAKFNPDGSYFLNTTTNASLNALFANTVDYADGQPVPAGKYTLIAKTDQTLTGELLIGVQAVVKRYVGIVTGNDLVIQDSDALPSVVSMFGSRPGLDGNYGGPAFEIPSNGAVQITFSMAMARLTILGGGVVVTNISNTAIGDIDGKWKVSPDLLSATFYPDIDLEQGDTHRVRVIGGSDTPSVKNVYGKSMNKTIYGTFIVGPEDVTAPEAIRISPPKSVKDNMPITTPLRIAADEPLDLNTMEVASSPSIGVKPNVIFIGKSLKEGANYPFVYEIVPSEPFDLDKNYLVTVSGAKDLALNDMIDLTFNFTTEKTSAGIDPNAPALVQETQADVKDVFGKWIRAFDDRSIPVLTSYMSGDFLWASEGGSDDLNRDGLLSLGEFSSMLETFFLFLEGCDSDVTGAIIGNIVVSDFDTADLAPYDRATMKFTITTTPNNTTNTQCSSEGPDAGQVLTANLELRNGSWIIVSGADPGNTPPTGTHRAISLVSPADNEVLATTAPPTLIWNGIDGVETYAVIMLSARVDRAGWVALVSSDGLDTDADRYEVTYTPDLGYADGLKVNGTSIPDGIYTLCNYENENLCGGRLQRYFDLDRRINTGMREGSNINWSVIGLGVLNTTDLITDGISQKLISNDVVAAGESRFFSVAGEWKEITVSVVGKSGEVYSFSPYVGGYDVGSADSVTVIINTPAEWAGGSGTMNHSGLDWHEYALTFDSFSQVKKEINLYNKGNYISLYAYKPGAQTEAGRLYKSFNILTKGGIPPGLSIDRITDFSSGADIPLNEWGHALNNTVLAVNIYGHRNDPDVANVRLSLYANNGRHEGQAAVDGAGNFSFSDVPVFEGWNSINVQDTNWENQSARDYVYIEVEAPGGSVYVNPIQFLGGSGLTESQTSIYSVTYDAGALSLVDVGVAMVANLGDAVNTWDYAGWYEDLCDPEGYSCTSTGFYGEIAPDGSWMRYEPGGIPNSSGPSIGSIQFDLFRGSNNVQFYDEFRKNYRSMRISTTGGKLYVPPIDVSFTTTAPGGATATSKYVSGNSSDWDTDADTISLNMVMRKLGVGTTSKGSVDHYLSTDTDWMRVGYAYINATAPKGSWYKVDPISWNPLTGIGNTGASISDVPVELYTGQNVFYIDDGNGGYYYLYVTTTAGKIFTPDIETVNVEDGAFNTLIPQYSSSTYADIQTDVDNATLRVKALYDDTWPLDGGSNMINGIAYTHQAQGVWQTYYGDLTTAGTNQSPLFNLITGNNYIEVCYKPVPDSYDPNYIVSCGYRYTVYVTTTGGITPSQWVFIDSPPHNTDITFTAKISVTGHIDNSVDGFTPSDVYAYIYNTADWSYQFFGSWRPVGDPEHLSYDPVTMTFTFTPQFWANQSMEISVYSSGQNSLFEWKSHYARIYINNKNNYDPYFSKPGQSGRVLPPRIDPALK